MEKKRRRTYPWGMKHENTFHGFCPALALVALLVTGCVADEASYRGGYSGNGSGYYGSDGTYYGNDGRVYGNNYGNGTNYRNGTIGGSDGVVYQDDYDYYPNYELYYGRQHHEYIYRDGDRWVRRAQPMVGIDRLRSAPAVQLRFHDSPEQHHREVIRTYPRNWRGPVVDRNRDGYDDRTGRPYNR
jgi:hypothetical protein